MRRRGAAGKPCGKLEGLEVDPPALGEAPGIEEDRGGEVWMVEYVTGPGP